jgi:hypothetical protein
MLCADTVNSGRVAALWVVLCAYAYCRDALRGDKRDMALSLAVTVRMTMRELDATFTHDLF